MDLELVQLERSLQLRLELEPLDHALVHRRLEDAIAALAVALGHVHRHVGVAEKLLGVGRSELVPGQADADARAWIDLLAVDVVLQLESAQNPSGDVGGLRRVRNPVEQDGELVAAEAGNRVRRAHGALEALRHLPQDRVAGRVAEAVVDGLEIVQIDEHDADRPAAADRAHDGLLDAVCEQRSVGEACDGVVEGLVRELILERLALADVSTVQHDAADVLVLQQVCVLHLELEPGAVSMPERALDHVCLRAAADVGLADARQDLRQPRPVGHADQLGEVASLDLVGAIAEDTLD